jgi:hypothetical protein
MAKSFGILIFVFQSEFPISYLCDDFLLNRKWASAYDTVFPFLDDVREGPIPSMYLVLRFLNCFSLTEGGTRCFTALDFSGNNVIIAGQVLYLRDIRYFVEAIINGVKELLQVDLFFGLDTFNINWSPGMVHDEPRNRSIGYSCFDHQSSHIATTRWFLVAQVLLPTRLLKTKSHSAGVAQQLNMVRQLLPSHTTRSNRPADNPTASEFGSDGSVSRQPDNWILVQMSLQGVIEHRRI